MATDNLDVARRGYAALGRGDVQTVLSFVDRGVEINLARESGQVLGPGFEDTYRGHDGFLRFLGQLMEAYEDVSWEAEDFVDAGGDRVVVLVRMRVRGRASGAEIDRPLAHVCTLREGALVRLDSYTDRAEALRAAGVQGGG